MEALVPIFRVAGSEAASRSYARLGSRLDRKHQFGTDMPFYAFLSRGNLQLHLSEHTGDARPGALVYFYVQAIEPIAHESGAEIEEQPWSREGCLSAPDSNRLRIGQRKS